MGSSDFTIVESAFREAVALSPETRPGFLHRFGMDHPRLLPQLRALLAADEEDDEFLKAPIATAFVDMEEAGDDHWIGRELGVWTLRRRLGSGGMGAVFLAERTDGEYELGAAVKVMSTRLISSDASARFRTERQILARLDHPAIARLIDGGKTEEGLPYFVMEYVEGRPINAHCEEERLDLRQRLRLFGDVCRAVDHAHRQLIVHRDLKPSNVLVDAAGRPKLLDFGIAKAIEPDALGLTPLETGESRAMTPEYAAPEQILGDPVSVATDVYALGCLLFHLLTNQGPFGDAGSAQEHERAILSADPPRPSQILASRKGEPHAPPISPRQVQGDLDRIVFTCLQKDQARRYSSVAALLADINAYLEGRPVAARGDHFAYRASRFARRHAVPLAASLIVLVSIVSLTTIYTLRLERERSRAETAAIDANRAALEAEEVSSFLLSVFASASPYSAQGQTPTAVDLLREGGSRIDELDDQPIVQARLLRQIGLSLLELGEMETGRDALERSVALIENTPAHDPVLLADSLFELAEAQRQFGETDLAIANKRRVLDIRREALGWDHPDTVYAYLRLGSALTSAARNAEAAAIFDDIITRYRERPGEGHPLYGDFLSDSQSIRSRIHRREGEDVRALALAEEALARSEDLLGPDNPNTIISVEQVGEALQALLRSEEALNYYDEAIRRGEPVNGIAHPYFVKVYFDRARVLQSLGRFEEAAASFDRPLSAILSELGDTSVPHAQYLIAKARWHQERAEPGAALIHIDRAIEILAGLDIKTHPAPEAQLVRGRILLDLDRDEDGIEVLSGLLGSGDSSQIRVPPPERDLAERAFILGLFRSGHRAEADARMAEYLSRRERGIGADNPALMDGLVTAAVLSREEDDPARALTFVRRALSLGAARLPQDDWRLATARGELARVLTALGERGAATEAEAAASVLAGVFGPDDPRVRALTDLAARTKDIP